MTTGTRTVTASPRLRTTALSAGMTALVVFAVVRGAGVVLIALGAWWAGKDPVAVLGTSWDSGWYIAITEHGYGRSLAWPHSGSVQSDLAFFPLYPSLMRLTSLLLPVGAAGAGLLVAWAAAAAAAVGVYRVGERVAGARTAVLLVALWGAQPHAVVFTTGYTESLLAALAAWALYALLRERWMAAAGLAVLAGLTRPTGIAVAAAVSVTALYALLARGGRRRPEVWAAGLLAPAGWTAYLLAVGHHRHDLLGGYFAVQDSWGSRFDFGAGAVRSASRVLMGQGSPNSAMTLVVLAVAVGLAVLLVLDRAPLPLLVYTAVLLVITLGGAGFFDSKPRFLLPAFPLLLPLAAAMARARPRTAVVVTGSLAGLSCGYGAYLMLVSHVPL
ncbi:mannosyltransferase family protein [Streptomyces sp. NPDC002138]|uniref:mannosyltransferase family protein n=1 Tax=Streptomyces sp. NPDC002138 TaxID=3154410 RepID=UPI00332232F4